MVEPYRYALTPLGEALVWLQKHYPEGFESFGKLDAALKTHPDQLWLDLSVADIQLLESNLLIDFGSSQHSIS